MPIEVALNAYVLWVNRRSLPVVWRRTGDAAICTSARSGWTCSAAWSNGSRFLAIGPIGLPTAYAKVRAT